jgi:hypothetical protein
METSLAGYRLPTYSGVMSHGWPRIVFLRDRQGISTAEELTVEAEVRSGDYFVTLATRLDDVGRTLSDYAARIELENVVSDLIYLQDNYMIIKNEARE